MTRQNEPAKGSQIEDTEQQRQGGSTDGNHDAARPRRGSDAAENTEQGEIEREVELILLVDSGLGGMDGGGRMDCGRRKRRAGEEGEADSERIRVRIIGGEPELRVLNLGEGWILLQAQDVSTGQFRTVL